MKPGIYDGMTPAWYHEQPGLSNSFLKDFSRSPAHAKIEKKWTPEQQKKLNLGTVTDTLLFESARIKQVVMVMPEGVTRQQKDGKALAKDAKKAKKILLAHGEYQNIRGMVRAVWAHPDASKLISQGTPQRSFFWKDPTHGFLCKCRTDLHIERLGIIPDLKTTGDARPAPFSRIYNTMKYHWQAAWYLKGVSIATGERQMLFAFIVVETDPPHGVNVYYAAIDDIRAATYRIDALLEQYAECLEQDHWPCYPVQDVVGQSWQDGILHLPRWAEDKLFG